MPEQTRIFGGYDGLTKPVVQVWEGLLRRAKEDKKDFDLRGQQIMSFYSGGAGAMWQPAYMDKFMGGGQGFSAPKFKVTLNVAFEQVAILGPLLFWQMANRKVRPHRSLQLDPNVLAGQDPNLQQMFNQLLEEQTADDARNEQRARVLEHILNYIQNEQPGGGLARHSDMAIFEALTKGAGFLKTEHYQFPFSDRTLVGSFFESVDNILVDPDCMDPLWQQARWVAIRHRSKFFEVEEHFGLRPGSLRNYTSLSTPSAGYQSGADLPDRRIAATKDLVEWYEIYSRAGFGNKLAGTKLIVDPGFDDARGDDFAYLCIVPGCPQILNMPGEDLTKDHATSDWVREQTNWPTEYWRDNKWPVAKLDFYPHDGLTTWPEPPLSPAIGELTILNILVSAYVQCAYDRRQEIIGVVQGAVADLQGLIQSNKSPLIVELIPGINKSIDEVMSFMKRPEVNADLPKTIEFVNDMVRRRTGLSDMLYGGNSSTQPRSATEYQGKLDTVNIRPEHMQKKVAAWQSDVADKEVFCLYKHTRSRDIREQLGPLGVAAYDELVTNEAPENILRGSKAYIEASDIRRPNKAKDAADLQQMQQYLLPVLANELAQHGDPQPLNGFVQAMGDAMEIEVGAFLIPAPEPDEGAQQMQQAELAKVQSETDKLTAEAERARADAQTKVATQQNAAQDNQLKMAVATHAANLKQQTAEHGMQLKEQQAILTAQQKQHEMATKQDAHEQLLAQKQQEARQKLGMTLLEAAQKSKQNQVTHLHQTGMADQKAQDDARRGNLITYQKLWNTALMHNQKMQQQAAQPQGNNS